MSWVYYGRIQGVSHCPSEILNQNVLYWSCWNTAQCCTCTPGRIKRGYFCSVHISLWGWVAAAVTQVCILKSWDVFGDVFCHDLAILLCCITSWEKTLCAVYLVKVLMVCGSTGERKEQKNPSVPMLGGVGWGSGAVNLLWKRISSFSGVFHDYFVYRQFFSLLNCPNPEVFND